MLQLRRTLKAQLSTFKVKRQRLKILLMDPKMVPKRKLMPRLLLKRFMTLLTGIVRCQILSSQKYAQIQVSYKGDKWAFNVDVYKEKKVHHQALKNLQNLKASSSDDSQTETRMSSSSLSLERSSSSSSKPY